MKALIIAAAAVSLLALGTSAKPEPFDPKGYTFESSGARVVSTNDKGYGGLATTGVTRVYDKKGALLYEIPVFSGRCDLSVSPDGSVVVMDGNMYYGPGFVRTPMGSEGDPVVTQVYQNGVSWKNVTYLEDLAGPPLEEGAKVKKEDDPDLPWGVASKFKPVGPFQKDQYGESRLKRGYAYRPLGLEIDWDKNYLDFSVKGAANTQSSVAGRRTTTTRHVQIPLP